MALHRLSRLILPRALYQQLRRRYFAVLRKVLRVSVARDVRRIIIFLTPGTNHPSGGVLSIASLATESRQLVKLHHAEVIWCTLPGDPSLLKYRWFENRLFLHDADTILRRCTALESLMLHIPEYAVDRVATWLQSHRSKIEQIKHRHLNVLLQNIDQIEGQNISTLRTFGEVTCTTAHEAYSNVSIRQRLGIPLHRMSVYISPEQYRRTAYEEKDHLLIYSPDGHPRKEEVLSHIANHNPELQLREIRGLSYEKFKDLIRRAKWSLTFGEGLDGYFAEPIFSGSVSFAVFNKRFFTPEFAQLPTVCESWDDLIQRMPQDLTKYDNAMDYNRLWAAAYDRLTALYDIKRYRDNLRQFYLGNYTFP